MPHAHGTGAEVARPAGAFHAAARAVHAVPVAVSRQEKAKDPEHGAVIHPAQDHGARVGDLGGPPGDGGTTHREGVDRQGHAVGDVHQRGQRVGAIVGGGDPVAPVVAPARNRRHVVGGHRVVVFSLGVGHLADGAGPVQPPHLHVELREGVVLGQHVGAAGLLDSPAQRDALRERLARAGLAHDVEARFERADGERRVLVKVVRQHHGVHVVIEELPVVGVGGDAEPPAHLLQPFLPDVAHRDQLHADQIGRARREALAAADADHAHPDRLASLCHLSLPPLDPHHSRSHSSKNAATFSTGTSGSST